MKSTKKAFTLVELIVVITILAVLATVAFISLTGYSQDAKNSKVASDIRSLVSAIEAGSAKGTFTIKDIVVSHSGAFALSGGLANTGAINFASLGTAEYKIGEVDFPTIQQNGDDFTDGDNPYLVAFVSSGSFAGYNVAGQTKNAAGSALAYIAGNYIQVGENDVPSLIAQKDEGVALADEATMTDTTKDLYGNE